MLCSSIIWKYFIMFSIYKEYNIDYESFNKFKLTLNFNQIIFTIKNPHNFII